jgi:uncharacterized protein YjbI with pentapeptide repeats
MLPMPDQPESAAPAVSAAAIPAAARPRRELAAWVALALAALVLGLGAHRVWQGRARQGLIRRMERSAAPLSRAELARAARRFGGDRELLGASLLLAGDAEASDAARWNGLLMAAAVAPRPSGAGVMGGILTGTSGTPLDWRGGEVAGARLVDLTLARGRFTSVTFADSTFAGVTWGAAFAGGRPGLVLSEVRFLRSRFAATTFSGTHLERVEFVDSRFTGSDLDLSNCNRVRFARSGHPAGPAPAAPQALPAEIVLSAIVNRGHPPPPGIDDLAAPTDQVSFTGIAFDGVHFRGWIRPEWFSNCTFTRCVFPTALTREALAAGHNALAGCLWSDEPLR